MFTPIHKTISVSDFQRKAKVIFQEVNDANAPTVVMNRNKPISVVMSPEVYEKMIEDYEDLYDGMLVVEDERNDNKEKHISWDQMQAELKNK